jgi:D-alanyl-D-alanine carboxypeptidase
VTAIFRLLENFRYRRRIGSLHAELGIPRDYARSRDLPLQREARQLVSIGPDIYQRDQQLVPPASAAWKKMQAAARDDGIELQVVSAYRSVDYQRDIVRRKLEKGLSMEEILLASAAPGYSEHHSGRALDLTTPGSAVLEEEFERSDAYPWLCRHAGRFGFHLSYPRDNPHGVLYEPWHWAWRRK